jgi:predicted NACHT family NTPase
LLDGLDEVKDSAQRSSVLQQAANFFTLHKQYGNQFVLTSRIIGYEAVRLPVDDVVECIVEDFDNDDINRFIENWSRVIERADQGGDTETARRRAQDEEVSLKRAIFFNPKVRDRATNPLMLTIMAVMNMRRWPSPAG